MIIVVQLGIDPPARLIFGPDFALGCALAARDHRIGLMMKKKRVQLQETDTHTSLSRRDLVGFEAYRRWGQRCSAPAR